jgi:hypothetical protein
MWITSYSAVSLLKRNTTLYGFKNGNCWYKRRISHQSIAEQLYIEPHQGIKSQTWSRDQIRRAISGLARAEVIVLQSEDLHLILKCQLATLDYSVQNKAAINPPQKATINPHEKSLVDTGFSNGWEEKADTVEPAKAATPHNSNNYIYLLPQFEKFWSFYPHKNSKQKAWDEFQRINPDEQLCNNILSALKNQIKHREEQKQVGEWVPPWKFPANWLAQHCWNDELTPVKTMENNHATHKKSRTRQSATTEFWNTVSEAAFDFDDDREQKQSSSGNVVLFRKA